MIFSLNRSFCYVSWIYQKIISCFVRTKWARLSSFLTTTWVETWSGLLSHQMASDEKNNVWVIAKSNVLCIFNFVKIYHIRVLTQTFSNWGILRLAYVIYVEPRTTFLSSILNPRKFALSHRIYLFSIIPSVFKSYWERRVP